VTPIRLTARTGSDERTYVHESGPLEIGRGRPRDLARFIVMDPTVSRDHLRMELQANGQLLVENLSTSSDVLHNQGPGLRFGDRRSVNLPVTFAIGQTDLVVELAPGMTATPPEPVIGYTETLKEEATTAVSASFSAPPPAFEAPAPPAYEPPAAPAWEQPPAAEAYTPPAPPAWEARAAEPTATPEALPPPPPVPARPAPSSFFAPTLAERIAEVPALIEAREREVTVLSTVVTGLAAIAARMEPQDTFALLQDVADIQATFIHDAGGVIIEDGPTGLTAIWNAPAGVPDHAWIATLAAQRIAGELQRLDADVVTNAGSPLRMGIGLALGRVLAGPAGGRWRQQYGAWGPVLREARAAALGSAELGVGIAATSGVRRGLPAETPTRRLGHARTGEGGLVEIWELVAGFPPVEWEFRRDGYQRALSFVEEGRWAEAIDALRTIISEGPSPDLAAVRLLSRVLDAQAGRGLENLTEIA
jgi:class 3 adenylate cyclase